MLKSLPVQTVAGLLSFLLLCLQACGAQGEEEARAAGELQLERPPTAIVAANAAWVDLLMELVSPGRVAGLPAAALEYSRLAQDPRGWEEVPRFQGFTAETLIALEPDLVLSHSWQSPETTAILRESGIPVWDQALPRHWGEILESVTSLGRLLGVEQRAQVLMRELEQRTGALRRRAGNGGERALSYSNLGTGGWAAGADTTADVLFELAGLENAAALAGHHGHQSLDLEALIAIDPDWIVVGTAKGDDDRSPTEDFLRTQSALENLRAVREDRIVVLSPRLFTTSSIEILSAAEELVGLLEQRR